MNNVKKPQLHKHIVSNWALSNLSDKVKYHLKKSVKSWHNWDSDLPNQVEVICNEVKRNHGQFLNVRRWLIIPPESGFKECLVAEIDERETSKFFDNEFVHIHINHLIPDVGLCWVVDDGSGCWDLNQTVHRNAIDYSTGKITGNIYQNPNGLRAQ